MLILTETDVEEGATLAEKLRTLVERERFNVAGNPELSVTISIGIVGGVGQQLRMETLVRDADAAMYSAKSLGRNQTYIFAEPDEDARVPRAPISAAGRAHGDGDRPAGSRSGHGLPDVGHRAAAPSIAASPRRTISTIVVSMAQIAPAARCRGRPHPRRRAARTTSARWPSRRRSSTSRPSSSSADWRSVVQHPRIGQVILEQAAAFKDAVPIILHHHERFAGHGYPFGLRAAEIPLGARIVAIADAYDAMTNDRPYRRAMSHDEAVAELRRHAGTQFDPELVSLFCDLFAVAPPAADPAVLAMTQAAHARRPPGDHPGRLRGGRRRPSARFVTDASSGTLAPDNGIRVDLGASPAPPPMPHPAPEGKGRVAG